MKITRFRLLTSLLLGCIAAVLLFVGLERFVYRENPNYALIEDKLYMGGLVETPPPGTQAVLNLCEQADPYSCDVYLWKPIRDAAPAPNLGWLHQAVHFVDEQQQADRITYVHCFAGVSRSGMVVVAYLMRKNHWTRGRALEFVRSKRPETRPNPAFMDLLLEWERVVLVEGAARGAG